MNLTVEIEVLASGKVRARCPSLPGCVAEGPSREEAIQAIIRAIEYYVASFHGVGSPTLMLAGERLERVGA